MQSSDWNLLVKKIGVGAALAALPIFAILGSLYLVSTTLR